MANAHASAQALMAMALGIPAFVVGKSFITVLFAHQDTKAALKISLITTAFSTALAFLLIWPLKPLGVGHVGIALATSSAGWLNVYLLGRALRKRENFWIDDNCKRNVARMLMAAGAMAIVLVVFQQITTNVFMGDRQLLRLATLGGICALGGGIYIALCFRLGALRWQDVKTFLKPVPKDPSIPTGET